MAEKLYIVSNRLPVTVQKIEDHAFDFRLSTGGLVSGLKSIYQQLNINWVGHCGLFANDPEFQDLEKQLRDQRLIAVPLKKRQYNDYYSGTSNNAIWPLFHYFPSAMKFSQQEWQAYKDVNQRFAETLLSNIDTNDLVWIHDYHLMLLPQILRQSLPDLKIAYFHHIPFPSSEIFRIFPHREDILQGLLGADFIGFHTYDYVRHFLSSVSRVVGSEIQVDLIHHGDRLIKVTANPLGIDFNYIDDISRSLENDSEHAKFKTQFAEKIVFLGIDRLDYTKGIPERLLAFQEFLRRYEEYRGKVTFIQHCVPSRTEIQSYGNLKATIERLVGQINGEFAFPGYTPIQYLYRSLDPQHVISLYKIADVMLVSPLRDGLNLVCKEYLAARTDENGILVLSEFAGASREMGEAILVNPYSVNDLCDAMHNAVTMPEKQKQYRMRLLRARVKETNNHNWAHVFLQSWHQSYVSAQPKSKKLVGSQRSQIIKAISEKSHIFIFMDNDGTLTPIESRPELAAPKKAALEIIKSFESFKQVYLTIVTGRSRKYCEDYFISFGLPANIVAEHGAFIWHRANRTWKVQYSSDEFEKLKSDVLKLFQMYCRFTPGTHIEEKETSLVWHYRQAEPTFAEHQAKELYGALQQLLANTLLSVFSGKKIVEVRLATANKGNAVEYFLNQYSWQPSDALVTVGDDVTDEDMHRVKSENNYSIHVGKRNVYATYFLSSSDDFLQFLSELRQNLSKSQGG